MKTEQLNRIKAVLFRTVCRGEPERYYAFKHAGFRTLGALRLYERRHLGYLQTVVRPGDHALDIGAHFGVYSRFFHRSVGNAGTVTAVEPFPPCVRRLERWATSEKNIVIVGAAVSEEPGMLRLSIPLLAGGLPEPALGHVVGDVAHDDITFDVPSISVAELLERQHPDVVKIDAEGSEGAILRGLLDGMERLPRIVLFECWDLSLLSDELVRVRSTTEHQLCRLDRSGVPQPVDPTFRRAPGDEDSNYYLLDPTVFVGSTSA